MIDKTFDPKLSRLSIGELAKLSLASLAEARQALLELASAGISEEITARANLAAKAMARNMENLTPCATIMMATPKSKIAKAKGGKA